MAGRKHSSRNASKHDNTNYGNTSAYTNNAVHYSAPQLAQRSWAETPMVNYTEILNRQDKWKKLFARLPSITLQQRQKILDMVGENVALQPQIQSFHSSDNNFVGEVNYDQEKELSELMDEEGLTDKIEELRMSLPWEEWCAIWCGETHQWDCPATQGN